MPAGSDAMAADKLLALELNAMTVREREAVTDEIHGVKSQAVEETPTRVHDALLQLRRSMQDLVNDDEDGNLDLRGSPLLTAAYQQALQLGSTYVHGKTFRLKFLRAELFDARKAAVRMCKCLNRLVKYFGEEALTRQLYLTDLGRKEMKLMKEGTCQILPYRDRFERRIVSVAYIWDQEEDCVHNSRMKVSLYLFMVLSFDEPTQKNGVVLVVWPHTPLCDCAETQQDNSEIANVVRQCLPLRVSSFHLCLPNTAATPTVKAVFLTLMGQELRRVVRVHIGSQLKCENALLTFGIPVDLIPRSASGTIKTHSLRQWIKARVAIDELHKAGKSFHGMECPDFRSIAFRHGGNAVNYRPNQVLREILAEKEEDWNTDGQVGATCSRLQIVQEIIETVHSLGYSFWKWEGMWYERMDDEKALRRQIDQAMRDQIKRNTVRHDSSSDGSDGKKQKTTGGYSF